MKDLDDIVIEIGHRDMLEDVNGRKLAATAFRLARVRYPKAKIGFTIGGYDDDPREIYDVPEVREYIRAWAQDARLSDWRVAITVPWGNGLLGGLGTLQLCGCFTDDSPIVVDTPSGPRR